MQRIAIIDIGSNSARLVISHIYKNGAYNMVYNQKEALRLSQKVDEKNMLTEVAFSSTIETMKSFAYMCKIYQADKTIAVATAAIRNAANGAELVARVAEETGIQLHIISGNTEAYISYLGVINTLNVKDGIIFDLGGGSTELILFKNRKILESVSLPIGAVNTTSMFNTRNVMPANVFSDVSFFIMSRLEKYPWLKQNGLPLIGVGGTARTVAKIIQREKKYPATKIHNYSYTAQTYRSFFNRLRNTNLDQRKKISGLSSERSDIILAGSSIISCLLEATGAKKLITSGCGLREGLFFEYYAAYANMEKPRFDDILEQSISNFLKALPNTNYQHIQQVERVATMLFDQLQPLHGYGPKERRLLVTAARLHDVGKIINYYDHARHSAFIIGHAPIYGLTQMEQIDASFIAGFHHGISRKIMRSYRYAHMPSEEEWTMIRRLSTLLALAEASDLTYEQLVDNIEVAHAENVIVLILTVTPGATYNAADYEMKQLLSQFKKEFGASLLLVWK